MGVKIFSDHNHGHGWMVVEGDDELYASGGLFKSRFDALHNMLIVHTMMGIFVSGLARGDLSHVSQPVGNTTTTNGVAFVQDNRIRWVIIDADGSTIGESSACFETIFDAVDNLIIIYTMLSVRVAELAQLRAGSAGDS